MLLLQPRYVLRWKSCSPQTATDHFHQNDQPVSLYASLTNPLGVVTSLPAAVTVPVSFSKRITLAVTLTRIEADHFHQDDQSESLFTSLTKSLDFVTSIPTAVIPVTIQASTRIALGITLTRIEADHFHQDHQFESLFTSLTKSLGVVAGQPTVVTSKLTPVTTQPSTRIVTIQAITTDTVPLHSTPTSIPTSLPKFIVPPGGAPEQPADTSLAQIGFLYPLNYPFVLANALSQRQIFRHMASAISYGLQIPQANITVRSMRAYDTTSDLHYISTLVLFFVPSDLISELQSQILKPSSNFYHNPNDTMKKLTSFINPSFSVEAEKEEANVDASTQATLPSPTATALVSSSSGLPTRSKITVAVAVPMSIVTLLLMGLFFWRKLKHVRHQPVKPIAAEKDIDEIIRELAPDSRRFELPIGDHDQELPTEGRERFEVQGDLRWRQELPGSHVAQEHRNYGRGKRSDIRCAGGRAPMPPRTLLPS